MRIVLINDMPCAICEFDTEALAAPIEWMIDSVVRVSEEGWIKHGEIMRAQGHVGPLESLRNAVVDMRSAAVDHANVEASYPRMRASLRVPLDYVRIIGRGYDDTVVCDPLRGRPPPWNMNGTRLVMPP